MEFGIDVCGRGAEVRTIRRTARTLVAVVSVLLALFIATDCAAAQVTQPEIISASASADPRPVMKAATSPHGDTGAPDCQGVSGGRAPLTTPTPSGRHGCVCGCNVGVREPRTAITAPVTERQAVPVSRSGELPVTLQIFRC